MERRWSQKSLKTLTLSTLSLWNRLFYHWIWICPLLQIGMSVKNQNRIAKSVDPDETAHDEPSHQDLHCLHTYLVWSTGMKELRLLNRIYWRQFCFITLIRKALLTGHVTFSNWNLTGLVKESEFSKSTLFPPRTSVVTNPNVHFGSSGIAFW